MRKRRRPTEAELPILRVLWARGGGTVRDVAEALGREHAYTTVLKLLQVMTAKGLVVRDEATVARAHVYRPAFSEDDTQRQLVRDLLERVFDGSASRLVMQALSIKTVSEDERRAIRALLADTKRRSSR